MSSGVSDEAVEAGMLRMAAWVFADDPKADFTWEGVDADDRAEALAAMRAALVAAQPFMQPQVVASLPTLDRDAVLKAICDASHPEGSDNIMRREYVENWADVFADAVMAAVRPLPTREQIAEALHGPFCQASGECTGAQPNDYLRADMVLALMGGAETEARG